MCLFFFKKNNSCTRIILTTFFNSNGNVSVEEACQILVDNNISSAPVYVEGEKGHYIGMFDYGDVIAYILLVLHRKPGQKDSSDSIDLDSLEIKDIVRRALDGQKVPVRMASGKF